MLIRITYRRWDCRFSIPAEIQNSRAPINTVFVSTTMINLYYFCGGCDQHSVSIGDSFNDHATKQHSAHSSVISFCHVKYEYKYEMIRTYQLPKYVTYVNNRCIQFEICFIIQVCQINSNLTFAWYIEIINSIRMVAKRDLQILWKNFTIFLSLYTKTISIKFI